MAPANRGAGCTEKSDDLGGTKENAADQGDVAKTTSEIVEFSTKDQHGAGDRDGGKRDEPGDGSGDRLLDLL
jgi:hypothetical protein